MKILLTALTALVLAAPALAAPPSNDNRADAQPLPAFPSTAHGTTAEATLERLDPQVSKCGRIDATVWYRIDAAPDGTIVATVQAAGQLAPVVRIYRRNPSSIQEVSCGSAKAGGKVVASVATVRGAGYLILVGRFIPGGRTAVTLACGLLEMRWRRFIFFDVAAGLVTGGLHFVPIELGDGAEAGAGFQELQHVLKDNFAGIEDLFQLFGFRAKGDRLQRLGDVALALHLAHA
jgi:hypothetical protein